MGKIAAVDFDGTLVVHEWPAIGKPIQNTIDFVKELKAKGWKLILWTCRAGQSLDEAVAFCKDSLDITFDAINANLPGVELLFGQDTRKVVADIYIDDKSVNPMYIVGGKK